MPALSRRDTGFNPYAVGNKVYGAGRFFPTSGPVDKVGYRERDAKHKARQQAILNRMRALSQNKIISADAMRKV
jgi:hypothetical protein